MFAEIGETLSDLFGLAASFVNGTISSRRALPRPDDIVRTSRPITVCAGIPPLDPGSPRFDWSVPLGTRLRVEVTPYASAQPAYLVTIDPLVLELLPDRYRDRAARSGLAVEVPSALLRTHFA